MAIMIFSSGTVFVITDFTDDCDHLLRILETLIVEEDQSFNQADDDASVAVGGTVFGQDNTEFNIFNTDRPLSALQTAATMLGGLNEKKAFLYFASASG